VTRPSPRSRLRALRATKEELSARYLTASGALGTTYKALARHHAYRLNITAASQCRLTLYLQLGDGTLLSKSRI
jgi:hypothetical protein